MYRKGLILLLVVILGSSLWLYDALFTPQKSVLIVDSLSGKAWQKSDGDAELLQVGDNIEAQRRVFVNERSRVTLKLDQTSLSLEPNSSIFIQDIAPEHIQLSMDEGRIRARARRGSPRVEVQQAEQRVILEDGQVLLDISEQGGLQVKVEKGNAELSSYQQRLLLSSMEQGIILDNTLLRPPEVTLNDIPKQTMSKNLAIGGMASPGSRVEAAGQTSYAQANMQFFLEVPLEMGINQFTVIVTGPMDERTEFPIQIELVPPPPVLHHAEIKWQ